MFILALVSLLSTALAVPPIWFTGGKCGVSKYPDAGKMPLLHGKIVGGKEARPNEFPWQVSIRHKVPGNHECGGSIINDRWVVSSASCIFANAVTAADLSLVFGEHIDDQKSAVRQTIDVASIIRHEKYDGSTLANDIALFKTAKAISLNENVAPICAPDPTNRYTYQRCVVSGWGNVANGERLDFSHTLMYAVLNVSTSAYCNSVVDKDSGSPKPHWTDTQICATDNAGDKKISACTGDYGGPLSVKDGNGVATLIGLFSFQYKGCAVGFPGGYTAVGAYVPWITDKIAKN